MSYWRRINQPISFQGARQVRSYFEGWYFKITDSSQGIAFAIIPGIAYDENGEGHVFIQTIDGVRRVSSYHEFDLELFEPSKNGFGISIANNHFSRSELKIDLEDIKMNVNLSPWAEIPRTWKRPGIMGWYAYMPFMQCYHGLGSMNHTVQGELSLHQSSFQLLKAKGYMEKDWGRSFPKAWIWTQCNNFECDDLSVFASVAHIPWIGSSFIGFLAVVYYNGNFETFATYTGAERHTMVNDDSVRLEFRNGESQLLIESIKGEGSDLRSPISGSMTGKVNESLTSKMKIKYSNRSGMEVIEQGVFGGLEVAGDTECLLT